MAVWAEQHVMAMSMYFFMTRDCTMCNFQKAHCVSVVRDLTNCPLLIFFVVEWNNKKVLTERINYTSSKNELYDVYFTVEFDAI